ncbi:unnamed protein product [Oikopleura dioica]|uniref:Uncharacterized protein n=1 Tax=Oikopleura dioica TaxID=34765 RepID=E4XD55_OIKDI|nr:unnamed protein product [Oikopleura dioica]
MMSADLSELDRSPQGFRVTQVSSQYSFSYSKTRDFSESILKSHLEEERNGIHCARKRSFAARSYEPASCLSNSSFRACFPADSSQGSKTNALPKSCTRF